MKKQLSYKQSLRPAIVFLNMFGLYVKEPDNIFLGDKLDIITESNKVVGNIDFEKDQITIMSQTNMGLLSASYQVIEASGFRDEESAGMPRFAGWSTNINYSVIKNDVEHFDAVFMINCSIDDEFGFNCSCQHKLDYFVNGEKILTLKIKLDGELFGLEFFEEGLYEYIKVMPYDDLNGFIIHDIRKGECCEYVFPYRKYSGVFPAGKDLKHQLMARSETSEYKSTCDFEEFCFDKINYNYKKFSNSEETIMQMGDIMKNLDPDMYLKINDVQELLTINNFSLFDSFISVGYEEFSDEVIKALLGIVRKPLNYGGNKKELKKLYSGENNPFLLND